MSTNGGAQAILRVEGLVAGYGSTDILRGVDLSVAPGQIVAVLGANGSGKSTLLKSIMGLSRIRAGTVRIDGEDLNERSVRHRIERGIRYLPQGLQIFPSLTVRQNIEIAWTGSGADGLAFEPSQRLSRLPVLVDKREWRAARLSGGERQIVALARTIWRRARVLLLDEPFLGLAGDVAMLAVDAIRSAAEQGTAVVVVEQNADLARSVAREYVEMEAGRVRQPLTAFAAPPPPAAS